MIETESLSMWAKNLKRDDTKEYLNELRWNLVQINLMGKLPGR